MKTVRCILSMLLMFYLTNINYRDLFAQNVQIRGVVTDISSNKNINGVLIYALAENQKKQIGVSDTNGRFVLQYPPSATALVIEKKGFRTLNIPAGPLPAGKTPGSASSDAFFVQLPMIPLDQQASDRPYMQSEQQDFILNADKAGKKKVTRLFKIQNALTDQQIETASICFEFTKIEKKDCKEITPANLSQKMVFEEADIVSMVVESAGYQTYRGNLILEKMDGSNSVYEVKMTPEVTIVALNVRNIKSDVKCFLVSVSGNELAMSRETSSFYTIGKIGVYTLNISNTRGGLLHSEKVNVTRGLNYLVVSLTNKPPVYSSVIEPVAQKSDAIAFQPEVAPLPDSARNVILYFEQSNYVLLPEAKQKLDQLAMWLKNASSRQVRIVGHSDNVGDPKKNETLSEYRARVTYNYLFGKGITQQQMQWAAIGSRRPIEKNDSEENKKKNRRVEITLFP